VCAQAYVGINDLVDCRQGWIWVCTVTRLGLATVQQLHATSSQVPLQNSNKIEPQTHLRVSPTPPWELQWRTCYAYSCLCKVGR
jgi:hypothetical protein